MSDRILVLGGSGLIGSHIVKALVARDWPVRVLLRDNSPTLNLDGLPVERVKGDLRDHPSLLAAMSDCRAVFHAAGYYPLYSKPEEDERQAMREIHNVLEAAAASGIGRLVYTSSPATIGSYGKDGPMANEDAPYHLENERSSYFRVKYRMEQEVLNWSPRGLDVVLLNPAFVFGPGDVKPSSGQLLLDLANRRIPAFLDGPLNVVDVRDVAESHIAAFERGKRAERYILGGTNTRMSEVIALAATIADVRPPTIKLPLWAAELAADFSEMWSQSVRKSPKPGIPRVGVDMLKHAQHLDDSRARQRLGHAARPLEETLRDTYAWFAQNDYWTRKA